jgi:hypothetical protein
MRRSRRKRGGPAGKRNGHIPTASGPRPRICGAEGEQIVLAAKFFWALPPKHLAELACSRDLADLPGTPRAEKMAATFGVHSGPTSADLCIDLESRRCSVVWHH